MTTTMTMMRTMTTVTTTESAPPREGPAFGRLPSLSVRTRLVGSVAVLSALGFIGAGAAALFVERQRIESRVEQSLAREIGEFTELASAGTDPRTGQRFADAESLVTLSMERNIPDQHETHLAFLAALTIVPVDGTGSLHLDADFRSQVTGATVPGYGSYQSADQGRVAYAVMPFTKDGQRSHFVTAYFVDREFDELAETIWLYAVAAAFAWAGLVMAAWLLARRILQPIEELRSTAATITETDVSKRITVTGADEVADLGRTVNDMLDRLEDALDSQRRMLDDAGHELKTPITVIRGHLELMDEDDASDVRATRDLSIDELDRMARLVEDLLVLAKARRPDFLRRRDVDVAAVVTSTYDKAQALAPRRWVLDPMTPVPARVDSDRLTQALLQLASNAVAVTDEGDTIGFGCAAGPDSVRLWVRDTGPGVPPGDRLRIFERFESGVRATEGRSTGLGLAIVSAIARAHGGSARVVPAGPAGGSRFILEVPTTNPDLDHDGSWPDQEDYDSVTTIFERVNAGAGRS
jgi:two-component system OmpR family sensor kinase